MNEAAFPGASCPRSRPSALRVMDTVVAPFGG